MFFGKEKDDIKFNKLVLIVALLFFCLTAGCSRQSDNKLKIVKIGVLQVPDDVAIAREKGYLSHYFNNEHLKVKYIIFDSGVDANKALMSGDVDFATMGDTNALVALNAGIRAKLVWINSMIGSNEALVVRNGSHIHKLSDLRGKNIATPFASTSHYSLMMTLKREDILKKVNLYDMDTQDIVAAWDRGDIDAAYTWQPTLSQLLKSGHILVDSKQLKNQGYPTANVMLVRSSFAVQHPHIVAGFLRQLNKAHILFNKHRETAIFAAAKQTGISKKEAKLQIGDSQWPTYAQMFSGQYLGKDVNSGFIKALYSTENFMYRQQTIDHAAKYGSIKHFIRRFNFE